MSKQRLIETCFWDDNYVIVLDPCEKLVFLYALTNPLTTLCGVYEISLKRIAFDTGFDIEVVKRVLLRFERDDRLVYRNGWMAIRNWIKHQRLNPSIEQGIARELEKVPPELAAYVRGGDSLSQTGTDSPTQLNLTELNQTEEEAPASDATPVPPPVNGKKNGHKPKNDPEDIRVSERIGDLIRYGTKDPEEAKAKKARGEYRGPPWTAGKDSKGLWRLMDFARDHHPARVEEYLTELVDGAWLLKSGKIAGMSDFDKRRWASLPFVPSCLNGATIDAALSALSFRSVQSTDAASAFDVNAILSGLDRRNT